MPGGEYVILKKNRSRVTLIRLPQAAQLALQRSRPGLNGAPHGAFERGTSLRVCGELCFFGSRIGRCRNLEAGDEKEYASPQSCDGGGIDLTRGTVEQLRA